jgi:hypothetical protein
MNVRSKRKAVPTVKMSVRSKRKAVPERKDAASGRRKKPKEAGSKLPEWCVCSHCVPEVVVAKRVCCMFAPALCDAVTHATEIQALLHLTHADIAAHPDLWTRTPPPASVAVMTNLQKRLVCYRKLFRLLTGIGRQGHWSVLPSCCRAPIGNAYP